jgi:UDP-glucose 4-epimerase
VKVEGSKQQELTLRGSTVVVTGGAGFIGSHLVRALIQRGASQVTVVDSLRYGDVANLGAIPEVSIVPHSLGTDSTQKLEEMVRGADLLFHLAAEKHNQSKESPYDVIRANVDGSLQVFLAAARAGVKKIVYTSSLYAYGRIAGDNFKETDIPAPQTVYGMSKLAGEHLLAHIRREYGIPFSVVRYLFVYGPKQFAGMGYKSVILKNFERLLRGERPIIFGDGKQSLDYIYVDDAVEATVCAMERDLNGEVINVGRGEDISVERLVKTMCEVTGRPFDPIYEACDWTAGTRRVGDISKARAVLDWTPNISLQEGLAKTVEWMKNHEEIGS